MSGPRKPGRLLRRSDFLAVARTRRKWAAPGLVLQARRRDAGATPGRDEPARLGFTASRKVGNAVRRNRARRRLRALAREVIPSSAAPGYDYVLIARAATADRPYGKLRGDLEIALRKVGAWRADAQRSQD